MNWEAIGAIGEILGAIAVVATLGYLAVQVRQSSRLAKADMTKDLFLASRSAILDIAASERLTKTYAEIRGVDTEFIERYTFYSSFFRLYELQFRIAAQDLLDENIGQSYERIIKMFAGTQHFDAYWAVAEREFSDEFADYVNAQRKTLVH